MAMVVALLLLALPAGLSAQELSDTQREEARGIFEAGRAAFSAARYAEALDYFQRSHAISGLPEILYNIGRAAEQLGEPEVALEAYEEFLRERPGTEDRAAIEARVARLRDDVEARLDAEVRAEPRPGSAVAPPDDAAPPAPPEEASPAPEDEAPEPSGGGAAGWVVLGSGGAVAVAGAVLLGLAGSASAEVSDAAPGTPWPDVRDAHADADAFGIAGGVLLGVGAAAMAAGLVWGLVELSSENADVAIGPGGVVVRGRF